MRDLLKNMRSSQIFSVCGLPEIAIHRNAPKNKGDAPTYQVELLGIDVFDPIDMMVDHPKGDEPGLVSRHGLQRSLFPRRSGILPAYKRLGRSQTRAPLHS